MNNPTFDPNAYGSALQSQQSQNIPAKERASVPAIGFEGTFNPTKNEAGLSPGTLPWLQELRASNQDGWDQAWNGIVGGLASGIGTAAETTGYILDSPISGYGTAKRIAGLFTEMDEFDRNWLSEGGKAIKDWANEAMPIYQQPGEWNWSDPGFYWSSVKGVLDSAVGFAIPGGLAAKAAGTALRAARLGAYLSRLGVAAGGETLIGKAALALGSKPGQSVIQAGLAGYLSNYGESKMMALEVYEQSLDYMKPMIDEGKLTEAQAKTIAGEQANDFMWKNKMFMLTDAFALHGTFIGKGFTRDVLPETATKTMLKDALKQGPTEFFEEVGQNVTQSEDIYGAQLVSEVEADVPREQSRIDRNANPYGQYSRILNSATSYQALYEGMLGLISGPLQSFGAKKLSYYTDKNTLAKQRELQEATIAETTTGVTAMFDKQGELLRAKESAINNGELTEATFADNVLWSNLKSNAFDAGTTNLLESQLNEIAGDAELEQDKRDRAEEMLRDLKQSEAQWIKFSNSPIQKDLFLATETESALRGAQADYTTKLADLQTAASIESRNYKVKGPDGKMIPVSVQFNLGNLDATLYPVVSDDAATQERANKKFEKERKALRKNPIAIQVERLNNTIQDINSNLARTTRTKAYMQTKEGVRDILADKESRAKLMQDRITEALSAVKKSGVAESTNKAAMEAKQQEALKRDIKPNTQAADKVNEVRTELGIDPVQEVQASEEQQVNENPVTPKPKGDPMPKAPRGDSLYTGKNGVDYYFYDGGVQGRADEMALTDDDFDAIEEIQSGWTADGSVPLRYRRKDPSRQPVEESKVIADSGVDTSEISTDTAPAPETKKRRDTYFAGMLASTAQKLANNEALNAEEKLFVAENGDAVNERVAQLLQEQRTPSPRNTALSESNDIQADNAESYDIEDEQRTAEVEGTFNPDTMLLDPAVAWQRIRFKTLDFKYDNGSNVLPVSDFDLEQQIKSNMVWDQLLDPSIVKTGTPLTLRVNHGYEGNIYLMPSQLRVNSKEEESYDGPYQLVDTSPGVTKANVKWNDYVAFLKTKYGEAYKNSEEYIERVPVQVIYQDQLIAHMMDPGNLYKGAYSTAVTDEKIASDRRQIRTMKKYLIDNGPQTTKVIKRTPGYFLKTSNRNIGTGLEELEIGISRDGKSLSLARGKTFNKKVDGKFEMDLTYAMVPKGDGSFIPYPVRNTRIGESFSEFVDSAMIAVDIALGIEGDLSSQYDRIAKEVSMISGYDIRTLKGLKDYLSNFLYIQTLKGKEQLKDMPGKSTNKYIAFRNTINIEERGSEIQFRSGTDEPYSLSRFTPEKVKVGLRNALRTLMKDSYTNYNLAYAADANLKVPLISTQGTVTNLGDYKTVFKRVLSTNLRPVTLSNGKKAYFGQPNIYLDLSGIVQKVSQRQLSAKAAKINQEVTSVPVITDEIRNRVISGNQLVIVSPAEIAEKSLTNSNGSVNLTSLGKINVNQLNMYLTSGSINPDQVVQSIEEDTATFSLDKNSNKYIDTAGNEYDRVTAIVNQSKPLAETDELIASQDAGKVVDRIVREYFLGGVEGVYTQGISSAARSSLITALDQLKATFDSKGLRVLSGNLIVHDKKLKVAGEIDLLLVDKNGNFAVYDIKTSKNFKNYNKVPERREKHKRQLNGYAAILNNTYGIKVNSIATILFEIQRDQDNPYIQGLRYAGGEPLELQSLEEIPRFATLADQQLKYSDDTRFKAGMDNKYIYITEQVTDKNNLPITSDTYTTKGGMKLSLNLEDEESRDLLPRTYSEEDYTKAIGAMSEILLIPGVPLAIQSDTIEQLSYKIYQELTGSTGTSNARRIFNNVMSDFKSGVEEVVKYQQAAGTQSKTLQYYESLLTGWSQLNKLVQDRLASMNGLKRSASMERGDGENSNIRGAFSEDWVYENDAKRSISSKVRKFLSFVPAYERRGAKFIRTSNKVFKGEPKYMPFDTVFNTLQGELSGTAPSFDAMMKHLRENVNNIPWYTDVADSLERQTDQIKNQFVSVMYRHDNRMTYVYFGFDKDGKVKAGVGFDNSAALQANIRTEWDYNLLNSNLVTRKRDGGLVISDENNTLIRLKAQYDSWVQAYKTNQDVPSYLDFINFMADLGITLSYRTVQELDEFGMVRGGTVVKYSDLFQEVNQTRKNTASRLIQDIFDNIIGDIDLRDRRPLDLGSVKDLARLEAKFNDRVFANSMRIAGKPISVHMMDQFIFSRTNELKDPKFLEQLDTLPYQKGSKLLNDLKEDSTFREREFNMFTISLDPLHIEGKKRFGTKKLASQPDVNHEVIKLLMFQKHVMSDGQRIVKLFYPTQSDKERMMAYTFKALTPKLNNEGELLRSIHQNIFNYVVLPEINRILAHQTTGIAGYDMGAEGFYAIPEMNLVKEFFEEDGSLKRDILADQVLYEKMIDILADHVNTKVDETIESWREMGVLGRNLSDPDFFDSDYLSLTPISSRNQFIAYDFVINSMVGNASVQQLFQGDPALYYDDKRISLQTHIKNYVTNTDPNLDQQFATTIISKIDSTFTNLGKRTAADIAPGMLGNIDGYENYRELFLVDPVEASLRLPYLKELLGEDAAKEYAQIDAADAQEFTTFKEFIDTMYMYGKIDKPQYNYLEAAEKKEALTQDDIDFVLSLDNGPNVMKPVYVGNHLDPVRKVDKRVYIKSSAFPLIRQMVKGLEIEKLLNLMESNQIQRAAFSSAVKVGNFRQPLDLFTRKGGISDSVLRNATKEEVDSSTEQMHRKNFRIQQDLPFDPLFDEINRATQAAKLLFVNMLGNPDIKSKFNYQGSEYSAEELQNIYLTKYEELFTEQRNKLERRLLNSNGQVDMLKLQDILLEEAESRGYPLNDILGLQLTRVGGRYEFRLPLWASSSSDRYEALLNSIVNNRVLRTLMPGHSFVLGSEAGFKTPVYKGEEGLKKLAAISGVIYTKNFNPATGLDPGYVDENGVVKPAQVLIPNRFKDSNGKLIDLTRMVDKDGLLDTTKLPEELLIKFGMRIPHQGPNSGAIIQVVGFLPITAGDLIIAPKDFTKQMGSDFDVDKLYTYMLNYVQKEDGSLTRWNPEDAYRIYLKKFASADKAQNLVRRILAEENTPEIGQDTGLSSLLSPEVRAKLKASIGEDKDLTEFTYDEVIEILERNGQLPTLEQFTEEHKSYQLQNDIVDVHLSVYNNPDAFVQRQIKNPLSYGPLQSMAATMRKKTGEDILFSPLSPDYHRRKYINATVGKAAVGVFSTDSTMNAAFQQGKIKFVGAKDKPFVFSLGGYTSNGDLSGMYTFDKVLKSEQISWVQSVALDNEKLQALGVLNINSQTFEALKALNQLGFPIELSINFLNQDIIREYVKRVRKYAGVTNQYRVQSPEVQAMEELEAEYGSRAPDFDPAVDYNIYFNPLTSDNFGELINNPDYPNYYRIQLASLRKFKAITEKGEVLKQVQGVINTDSKGLGTSYFGSVAAEDAVIELVNMMNSIDAPISGLEDIIGNTIPISSYGANDKRAKALGYYRVGMYYLKPKGIIGSAIVHGPLLNNRLWRDVLPYAKSDVRDEISRVLQMSKRTEFNTSDAKVEYMEDVWSNMKSYLFTNKRMGLTDENIEIERDRLFYKNNGNTPLAEIIQTVRNSTIVDNAILNALMIRITQSANEPSTARFTTAVSDGYDETRYYQAFLSLLTDDVSNIGIFNGITYTPRLLAQDMIMGAYLSGGIQEAVQYTKFAPITYLDITGASGYLRSLSFQSNTFGMSDVDLSTDNDMVAKSLFSRQFFQHMPDNSPEVPEGRYQLLMEQDRSLVRDAIQAEFGDFPDIDFSGDEFASIVGLKLGDDAYSPQFLHIPKRLSKTGEAMLFERVSPGLYLRIPTVGSFNNREYRYGTMNNRSIMSDRVLEQIDIPIRYIAPSDNTHGVTGKYLHYSITDETDLGRIGMGLLDIEEEGIEATPTSKSRNYALISKLFLDNLDKFEGLTLSLIKTGPRGMFLRRANRLYLNTNSITSDNAFKNTFLHEMMHAATGWGVTEFGKYQAGQSHRLTDRQIQLYESLQRMQQYLVEDIGKDPRRKAEYDIFVQKMRALEANPAVEPGVISTDELSSNYGAYKLSEFIAMAMTDRGFQEMLNNIQYSEGKTFLDRLKEWMTMFLESLGFDVNKGSLLESAIHDIVDLVHADPNEIYNSNDSDLGTIYNMYDLQSIADENPIYESDGTDDLGNLFAEFGVAPDTSIIERPMAKFQGQYSVPESYVRVNESVWGRDGQVRVDSNYGQLTNKAVFNSEDMFLTDEHGLRYPSIEHYMAAMYFTDPLIRKEFSTNPGNGRTTPHESGYISKMKRDIIRANKTPVPNNWAEIEPQLMYEALKHKFSYPYYQKLLVSTGTDPIIYHIPGEYNDTTLGMYRDQTSGILKGKNLLGRMLTDIRDTLGPVGTEISVPTPTSTNDASPVTEWKKFVDSFIPELTTIDSYAPRLDLGLTSAERKSAAATLKGGKRTKAYDKFIAKLTAMVSRGNLDIIQGKGGTSTRTGIPVDKYAVELGIDPVLLREAMKIYSEVDFLPETKTVTLDDAIERIRKCNQ